MLFHYVDQARCFPLKRTGGKDKSPIQTGDKVQFFSSYHKKTVTATVKEIRPQGLTLEVE